MLVVVVILCLVSANLALTPVEENQYYKVFRLSDVNFEELRAATSLINGGFRATVEKPYNGSIPQDTGGNFGDLEFSDTPKNGTLISRDTIINEDTSQNLYVVYTRRYNTSVSDFKLLNFGRQRGWSWSIAMYPAAGYVQGEILIAAGNKVRMFAEAYTSE